MEYNDFIKKIAFDKELNPFNAAFSIEKLRERILEIAGSDEISNHLSLAFFQVFASQNYKDFYSSLKSLLNNKNLVGEYYFHSLSVANHDAIVLQKQISEKSEEQPGLCIVDYYSYKTRSSGNELSIASISDVIVDLLD